MLLLCLCSSYSWCFYLLLAYCRFHFSLFPLVLVDNTAGTAIPGGHWTLASIHSYSQNRVVRDLNNERKWIGLSGDMAQEDSVVWADGTPVRRRYRAPCRTGAHDT